MTRILVIDDDVALTNTLTAVLRAEGYETLVAHTTEDGIMKSITRNPDVVLLDVMIPSVGGWEVCRRIREHSTVPIIFLTALDDTESVVRGLNTGGDDYITKPFEPSVMLARIAAQLRRSVYTAPPANAPFAFGDGELKVDLLQRRVLVHGNEVDLTRREFELLTVFVTHPGRVLTAQQLLQQAWDLPADGPTENIKPYIHYLRKKIESDPTDPKYIQTVRGIGYRFTAE